MKKTSLLVVFAILFGVYGVAGADLIFQDNFNSENSSIGTVNYSGFSNWSVVSTVDLIGNSYFDFLPGNGLYVDMDGSSFSAGTITTKTQFALARGTYTLSFKLAGNQINDSEEQVAVNVGFGIFSKAYSLPMSAGFTNFAETFNVFDPVNAYISFQGFGGDNIGMLLDDVVFEKIGAIALRIAEPNPPTAPVPEPATLLLLGVGLVGLAGYRRKKVA